MAPSYTPEFEELSRRYAEHLGEPQCDACKHSYNNGTCMAFPQRIPLAILVYDFDHRKPFPGDHGIRFEAKEDQSSMPAQ